MVYKRFLFGLFILFIALSLCSIWMEKPLFFLNTTDSIPRGLYLCVPPENIRRGDCVAYRPPDDVVYFMREVDWLPPEKNPRLFLKRVGALEGEEYSVTNGRFYINGHYIGGLLSNDSVGHALPAIRGTHLIPKGEFLPLSDSMQGFDGRYTGTASLNQVVAKAIPLLVVN